MAATYTKLRDGSWGVRIDGPAVAGQTVTVTKKSGESKAETVAAVVWSGNGVSVCSIGGRPDGPLTPAQLLAAKPARGYGRSRRRDCDDHCRGCRLCR